MCPAYEFLYTPGPHSVAMHVSWARAICRAYLLTRPLGQASVEILSPPAYFLCFVLQCHFNLVPIQSPKKKKKKSPMETMSGA